MVSDHEVAGHQHVPPAADAAGDLPASTGTRVSGDLATPSVSAGSLSGVRALVITASTRAAGGVYPDRGGPLIVEALLSWGAEVDGPLVVADGEPVRAALREAVTTYDLVVTTGGTGCSPTDATPEATRAVLDREIPGIPEALRADGLARGVAGAMLSRGVAGVAGRCVVVNLPGSTGGVGDGLGVLEAVLGHLVSQVRGDDH